MSTMVKTFALIRRKSFSSIMGIVYLGLQMALLMVWLGSMHIRSFLFSFSFTRMFESQFVGCVTGFIMPSLESLSNSSFTLSSFATKNSTHLGVHGSDIGIQLDVHGGS